MTNRKFVIAQMVTRARLKMFGMARLRIGNTSFIARKPHYQLRRAFRYGPERVLATLVGLAGPTTLFVDVGANIGLFSLIIGRATGATAVAFEPVPATFADLVANVRANPLAFVVPINLAVSDSAALLNMTNEPASGINRVVGAGSHTTQRTLSPVFATTLDRFMPAIIDYPFERLLIKIDVERHEMAVLRGARTTLATGKPLAVCVEYFSRSNLKEITDFLAELGLVRFDPPTTISHDGMIDETNAFFANKAWHLLAETAPIAPAVPGT